jgi:hypothetical protein
MSEQNCEMQSRAFEWQEGGESGPTGFEWSRASIYRLEQTAEKGGRTAPGEQVVWVEKNVSISHSQHEFKTYHCNRELRVLERGP